ncbi:Uncharacterised protein [Zhongshania aliphaticivorans]|uniref:Fe-S oxidoreductase n=1 Tax=Zhongshania aliphaticivorans TaxID=1470434 RepID=A0A5S9PJN2_9GAMM|nr:YkgJ family cysteine cluster protein [Zhongshania aliphaticivorans]CAA0104103.1 Uncharacterised protein [Zhongshania aliphaticivorans]CAA0104281.1 Uncharacterised protein [Zhongshania aliphaticivorans]
MSIKNATEQTIATDTHSDNVVSCSACRASCCRLEVMLISETGVPERFIQRDKWGGEVMKRLADGWCAALDRDTKLCSIYDNRPYICREFATNSFECLEEYEPR